MKESKVVLIILVMLILLIVIPIGRYHINKKRAENKQLEKANSIINTQTQNEIEIVTNEELEINDNIIGILEIPKLELIAPIQEGTSEEVLKAAIGHFKESSFWDGNVALASHNRSLYAQYFEKINELQTGDEIIYKTKLGERKYIVYETRVIEETDWSVIENTVDNTLTLITCIKNNSEKRLCVIAKEEQKKVEDNSNQNEENITNESIKVIEQETKVEEIIDEENVISENIEEFEKTQKEQENITEESENEEQQVQLDFSTYDRYYPGINGGYTCFKKNTEEITKLKELIETTTKEFGYANVKIVEDSTINKDRYFTANKTNVQNLIYGTEGFTIHYYAETEYFLSANGKEIAFQNRSYIQITGQ